MMLWVLITSGRGPGECQIAAYHLLTIMLDEAKASGIDATVLETQTGRNGLLSGLIALQDADTFVASWEGTIKWICPSPLRKCGRKNWFVSVSVIRPPAPSVQWRESDLRFEAYRASGPGGQHVNKTNSAVRVTHVPSGMTAQAQEERSQHRNKALAVARLAAMLATKNVMAGQAVEREKWSQHDQLERGNSVRTYRGLDFVKM